MCNNYELNVEWPAIEAAVAEAGLSLSGAGVRYAPAPDIRVNDPAPILRTTGNSVDLFPATWGLPPAKPGGAPVFNFRADNRDFADSRRCLIVASAFFEFTGSRSPKSKWRFMLSGHPVFALAGLWRPASADGQRECFTMLTMPPGPDIAPFHDRQVIPLPPLDWASWLYLNDGESPLQPLPNGSLRVELARAGREPVPDVLLAHTAEGTGRG